ncbi:MAG: M14 family metallopeptidase [Flavobacteriaceae bacterium]
MKKIILLYGLLSTLWLSAQVEQSYYLSDNHPYNPDIPTPQSVLGYEVGEWHVSHDRLVQYMTALAQASDRITLENRGYTFERRPLLLLTITSPENHQRIDEIKAQHQQLTTPEGSNLAVENMPAVLYQGFSIHGNEPSGANAGLLAAYHLAASEDPETLTLLDEVVVLFDPSFNPDGLQRFAYWANTNRSMNLNPDNNDREYSEVWPGGRTNHYWFDLNRDWLPTQLPESQARIKTYIDWLPNVLTDHHEMGTNSSFFFQPGIPDRVNPLTPDMNQKLTQEIGKFHAAAFDELGSLYYSEEDYDDFFYGKGSTYPDINGSIGILFEQASSRGHLQNSDNGVLTFPFTIRNQLTAAFSTLKAVKTLRVSLLEYMRSFYSNAAAEAAKSKQKALVFGNPKDPAGAYEMARVMDRHGIQLHKIRQSSRINGQEYPEASSYVVPLNQKKSRLIKALFNIQTQFKDSLFYDISAWSFPHAFNQNYSYLNDSKQLGAPLTPLQKPEGTVSQKGSYAYLFEGHSYYAPKALYSLLSKGIRVKVSMLPFTRNGVRYDYGTYMVPVQNQSLDADALYALMQSVAKDNALSVLGVNGGSTEGIDLGSRNFRAVELPKVALLVGDGVRSYDAGEIWHLMDTRYEIPITKIDVRNMDRVDLSAYTHLILPASYGRGLNAFKDKLKTFAQGGGTIIGYGATLSWLSRNELIDLKFKTTSRTAQNIRFDQRNLFRGAEEIGGAIFNTKIDRSHPINFGIHSSYLPVFKNTELFLEPQKNSYDNPILYTSNPLINGYISKENLQTLKNTSFFQSSRLGSGKVIVFTDNTNFRAFWYGTNRLLANALFHATLF